MWSIWISLSVYENMTVLYQWKEKDTSDVLK